LTRTANAVGDVRVERIVRGTAGPDTVSFVASSGGQTCSGSARL
jgi:hypothetical protein